jgi:hypothetical protein
MISKLLKFLVLVFVFSCNVSNEIDEDSDFVLTDVGDYISQDYNYRGENVTINFKMMADSTLLFPDLESRRLADAIVNSLQDNPNSSVLYSLIDTTIYVFESLEAKNKYLSDKIQVSLDGRKTYLPAKFEEEVILGNGAEPNVLVKDSSVDSVNYRNR